MRNTFMSYKDNIDKLNKIASTWGSTGNMEMDFMRNKIDEISQRPEEIAKSEALKEHFSDPKTYRDWLHDSNAWFGRTVSKVPGAIPNALGGIYDLGTGLLDLGINGATYGFNKLKGTPDKWQYKDYTRPDAKHNWGYNVGNWLNRNIGQPINSVNALGRALDYLTTAPDKKEDWSYFSVPEYSDALQKADTFNVMGMLEDAAAEAVTSAGVAKILGNKVTKLQAPKEKAAWDAKQDQVIRNYIFRDQTLGERQALRRDLSSLLLLDRNKQKYLDRIYQNNITNNQGFLKDWFSVRRANKLVKNLSKDNDKLLDYIIQNNPMNWDEFSSGGAIVKDLTRNDLFRLYKDYQKKPIPPTLTTLGKELQNFGKEPLFKGFRGGVTTDFRKVVDSIYNTGNQGDNRLWFSPLPEVALGYGGGGNFAIIDVPESYRHIVNSLKTPHMGSTLSVDDLLQNKIDKQTLSPVHGLRNTIGGSPDYEAAIPIDTVEDILKFGYNKVYKVPKNLDLTEEFSVPRTVDQPIPSRILKTPLIDNINSEEYINFLKNYGDTGRLLIPKLGTDTLKRPKVFNFKPYPGPSKWLGDMYYNQAGQAAAANAVIRDRQQGGSIPEYLRRK